MKRFIEDQKAENDAFRKEVKDSLSSTATDFKQRTDLVLDEMKSIQSDTGPVIERIDNLFTDKLFTGAKTFTLFLGDLRFSVPSGRQFGDRCLRCSLAWRFPFFWILQFTEFILADWPLQLLKPMVLQPF